MHPTSPPFSYRPLLRSLAWVALALVATAAGVHVATARADPRAPPLRDVLHELWSVPCPLWLPDLMLVACWFIMLFEVVVPSETLLCRAMLCFVLRAVTVAVTSVPSCAPPIDPRVAARWPGSMVLWGRHDLMFSGHTVAYLFFADLFDTCDAAWARSKAVQRVVRWIMPWTLVWARQHYTSDVIVAYVAYEAARNLALNLTEAACAETNATPRRAAPVP